MVFRKPYAFLIKNFKKIHILLVILCGFIYYKTTQLDQFVRGFIEYLSYDSYLEPVSKYTSIWFYLVCLATIFLFFFLGVILSRKGKPWKLYIIPIIDYIIILFLFIFIQHYFNGYDGSQKISSISFLENILYVFRLPQYPIFIILLVRIIGLDLKNFNFSQDEEVLELEEADREEFEVSVNIDKYAFSRSLNRTIRSLKYFYLEHKLISNIVIGIVSIYLVFSIVYYFAVSHKTINENETLNANNYLIKINKSYITDKDLNGNVLEKNSKFIILNMTVQNNGKSRRIDTEDFHIINGNKSYTFAGSTYDNYFKDIGNSYPTGKMRNGEVKTFALIFKVDKTLDKDRFVLYYEQYTGRDSYVRKIKIKLEDIAQVTTSQEKKLGDEIAINSSGSEEVSFAITNVNFFSSITYNKESCGTDDSCKVITDSYQVDASKKIMMIVFESADFDNEDFIDFSTRYGKIRYIDSSGLTKEMDMVNALENKSYLGKYLFLEVDSSLESVQGLDFIYTVRNKKYVCKIK